MSKARYFIGRRTGAGFPLFRIDRDVKARRNSYTLIDYFPTRDRAYSFAAILRQGAKVAAEADAIAEGAQP